MLPTHVEDRRCEASGRILYSTPFMNSRNSIRDNEQVNQSHQQSYSLLTIHDWVQWRKQCYFELFYTTLFDLKSMGFKIKVHKYHFHSYSFGFCLVAF